MNRHPPTSDESPLDDAVWSALTSHHAEAAEVEGTARRYPPTMSVFAAVERLDACGWDDLARLIGPGGTAALFRGEIPPVPAGWVEHHRGYGHQLTVSAETLAGPPRDRPRVGTTDGTTNAMTDGTTHGTTTDGMTDAATDGTPTLRRLTIDDVPDMMALVELTRPGPFGERTIEMGRYWGHGDTNGRLVAMAGERLHLEGWTEISAVCTHPDHRGRGLAATLSHHVATAILERGEQPFLHAAEGNDPALSVYRRLGFADRRMVEFALVEAPAG